MPALLRRLLPLLTAALILGPAYGADRAATAKMLDDFGMRQTMTAITDAADRFEAAPPGPMPAGLPDMMRLRFAPDPMFEEMTDAFAPLVSDRQVAAFAAFRATPSGRRLTAAEHAHSAARLDPNRAAEDRLRFSQADAPRRARLDRLDQALPVTDLSLTVTRTVIGAMLAGAFRARGDLSLTQAQIDANAARQTAGQAAKLREAMHVAAAGAYARLSDEDLDAYLACLETPQARAVHGAMAEAFRGVMERRDRLLAEDILDAATRGIL